MRKQPKRIAIYTRISKDETNSQLGVERQQKACREYILANYPDVNFDAAVAVFCDNNISAWSGARRPAYEALMDDLKARRFDLVVCYATDRLYRLVRQLEDIIAVIGEKGPHAIPVEAVKSGRVDLSTADGRFMARMMAAGAQLSSDKTSERLEDTNRQYAEKGWAPPGRAPYGYVRVPHATGDGHTYKIVPSEAKVLKRIAKSMERGDTCTDIARQLNREGSRKRSGKKWEGQAVRLVMMSPAIAGLRGHTPRSKKGRVWRQFIIGEGDWKAIIPRHRWEMIEMHLSDVGRRQRPPSETYWMSTALIAPDGRPMVGGSRPNGKRRYETRAAGEYVCIDADEVESAIERLMICMGEDFVGPELEPEEDVDALGEEIDEIDAQLADLARRVHLPDDDPEALLPVERAAEQMALKRRRSDLVAALPKRIERVLEPGVRLSERWWDLTPKERREVVVTYLGEIVVLPVGRRKVPVADRLQPTKWVRLADQSASTREPAPARRGGRSTRVAASG